MIVSSLPHITLDEAQSLLKIAGFKILWHEELVNKYWSRVSSSPTPPWFLFMTDVGLIELGQRKRVLSINWKHTPYRVIVTEDDVSKEVTWVHAWTLLKGAEYLTNLRVYIAKIQYLENQKEAQNA